MGASELREAVAAHLMSRALEQSLQCWGGLLEHLPIGVCVCNSAGVVVQYNERAAKLWGRSPSLTDRAVRFSGAWRALAPDGSRIALSDDPMSDVLRTGQPVRDRELVIERPDGSRSMILANVDPLFDEKDELVGGVNCFQDISERKQAEERQSALLDELNHRVKNTLATVQSLASQTLRRHSGAEALATFQGRLLALSRVHDQLTRAHWESADFKSILQELLAPYQEGRADRVVLNGEPIEVAPRVALTLSMVLHELTSNAAAYGALSAPAGALQVSWNCEVDGEQRHLHIVWQESGGPAVSPPQCVGFGSRLMQRGVEAELQGSAGIHFEPTGVRCSMRVPLRAA